MTNCRQKILEAGFRDINVAVSKVNLAEAQSFKELFWN
jgi:hypothetical protein